MIRKFRIEKELMDTRSVIKTVTLATAISGLISHGVMITSKYSFFDDINYMFTVGNTFTEDRWGLGVLAWLVRKIGFGNYSLPMFLGSISLIILMLISFVIVRLLDIRSFAGVMLVPIFMTVFPALTITFCYMYTAPYYMLGLLCMVSGIYIQTVHRSCKAFCAAIIFCAFSISIYQAYIPFGLSLSILFLISEILDNKKSSYILRKFLDIVLIMLAALLLYYVVAIAFRVILHVQNDGYKGIEGNYISSALQGIGGKIKIAYHDFIRPFSAGAFLQGNMLPGTLRMIYSIVLIILLLMTVGVFGNMKKAHEYTKMFLMLLFIALFPLSVKFINIMVSSTHFIYGIMKYSEVMPFLLLVLYSDRIARSVYTQKAPYVLYSAIIVLLTWSSILFSKFDNICYLKVQLIQSEAISYYTTLISRIESVEGYQEEYKVAFLGGQHKADQNWSSIPQLESVKLVPIDWNEIINDNSWIEYMKYWCGYDPTLVSEKKQEELENSEIVVAMPNYPNDGSIKVVDHVVVVKFEDNQKVQ